MDTKTKSIQEKNFAFYKKNAAEFYQKHKNKYLVIANESLVKDFDKISDAYKFWSLKFGLWNFIIQSSNDFCTVQYLSRLSFS